MRLSETNQPRQVVLCDAGGRAIGLADAVAAHTGEGQRHLAFSVYVFSPDRRQLLIQQRSRDKILWPLAWANTCCSHPLPNEKPIDAGGRRLQEELGFTCDLVEGPAFEYRAEDPNGNGVEHEYDICLLGTWAGEPAPNPAEVMAWKWIDVDVLRTDMREHPQYYAPWLHIGLPLVLHHSSR